VINNYESENIETIKRIIEVFQNRGKVEINIRGKKYITPKEFFEEYGGKLTEIDRFVLKLKTKYKPKEIYVLGKPVEMENPVPVEMTFGIDLDSYEKKVKIEELIGPYHKIKIKETREFDFGKNFTPQKHVETIVHEKEVFCGGWDLDYLSELRKEIEEELPGWEVLFGFGNLFK